MSLKNQRIIVHIADIKRWSDYKEAAASRMYHKIKEACGLNDNQPLTAFHLRDYWGLPLQDILQMLD